MLFQCCCSSENDLPVKPHVKSAEAQQTAAVKINKTEEQTDAQVVRPKFGSFDDQQVTNVVASVSKPAAPVQQQAQYPPRQPFTHAQQQPTPPMQNYPYAGQKTAQYPRPSNFMPSPSVAMPPPNVLSSNWAYAQQGYYTMYPGYPPMAGYPVYPQSPMNQQRSVAPQTPSSSAAVTPLSKVPTAVASPLAASPGRPTLTHRASAALKIVDPSTKQVFNPSTASLSAAKPAVEQPELKKAASFATTIETPKSVPIVIKKPPSTIEIKRPGSSAITIKHPETLAQKPVVSPAPSSEPLSVIEKEPETVDPSSRGRSRSRSRSPKRSKSRSRSKAAVEATTESPAEFVSPTPVESEADIVVADEFEIESPKEDVPFDPSTVRVLRNTNGIKYPATVCAPNLNAKRIVYDFAFLRLFSDVQRAPEGMKSITEIYGDDFRPSRNRSTNSSASSRPNVQMHHQGSHSNLRNSSRRGVGGKGGMGPVPPSLARQVSSGALSMSRNNSSNRSFHQNSKQGGNRGGRTSNYQSPSTPVEPQVVLPPRSENAFTVVNKAALSETELILRNVKSLLNKLTLENFERVSMKIINGGLSSVELLMGAIDLIFEKAINEPHFGKMYAQLCRVIMFELPNVQKWVGSDQKTNHFRRSLLKKCQEEFEKDSKWTDDDAGSKESRSERRKMLDKLSPEEKLKIAEEDYERGKIKRRVLGNIQFIGQLYLEQILSENIVHRCIMSLLKNNNDPEEEDIESFCKFMMAIGARLDHADSKNMVDSYFVAIKDLSTSPALSSRIQFLLVDVIDLRKNRWVMRTGQAAAGPKKIADIHKEAEEKLRREEKARQQNYRGGSSRSNNSSRSSQQPSRGQRNAGVRHDRSTNEEGWNTVSAASSRGSTPLHADLERFGQINASSQNVVLGPNNNKRSAWGRTEEPIKKSPSNMFAALEVGEAEEKRSPSPAKSKKLTKEEEKLLIDKILKEFVNSLAIEDLLDDVKEKLQSEESIIEFLRRLIYLHIDKNGLYLSQTVRIIDDLFQPESFDVSLLWNGIKRLIAGLEDELPDFPNAWKLVGSILAHCVTSGLLDLPTLIEIANESHQYQGLKPVSPNIALETFKKIGEQVLISELAQGNLDLTLLWPEKSRTQKNIKTWLKFANFDILNQLTEIVTDVRRDLGAVDDTACLRWFNVIHPQSSIYFNFF